MLKRKIYDYLAKWKKTKHSECLLVKGAQQLSRCFLGAKKDNN